MKHYVFFGVFCALALVDVCVAARFFPERPDLFFLAAAGFGCCCAYALKSFMEILKRK